MNRDLFIAGLTGLLLVALVYFRISTIRYSVVALYILFTLYVYYQVDRTYSLGMLALFIVVYMFVAKKPILEHFKEEEEEDPVDNRDQETSERDVDNSTENPAEIVIDEDVANQEEEREQEKVADEEEEGIERFKTEDKFTRLHELLHTITEQTKKATK